MIFQHSRFQIWNKNQHPYSHSLADFQYANPALPPGTVSTLEDAMNWLFAVLYPQTKTAVATPAALPALGNTLNDYRVVLDDGDGKAAAYRWEQREGEGSASWHKIYDMDWGQDSILAAFLLKTQDLYVYRYGYDDIDSSGTPLSGSLAGQHIYGGATANTHLTLHANSGDGVGADTGYIQLDDNARPTANATLSLGTTTERFLKVWSSEYQAGTLNIQSGSITDSLGTIDFDNENLTTDGTGLFGTLLLGSGSITDSSGAISFGNENLTTTGSVTANSVSALGAASAFFTGTTIADITFANGSITSASAGINFGSENLDTLGNLTAATVTGTSRTDGGNLRLTGNTLSATNANGSVIIDADGTGVVNVTSAMTTIDQTVTGTLGVTGQLNTDNLRLDGNTLSVTDLNGSLYLSPDLIGGGGHVVSMLHLIPNDDDNFSLGIAAQRWSVLYLAGAITNGTDSVSNGTLMSLRDINVGVAAGMSLFWNGTKWVASAPDTEIDHGTVSGLLDDDHTQYALLAGRSGGQTLNGGTAASNNLALQSTSNATKGNITSDSVIRPTGDGTIDFGTASFNWKDLYLTGQLYGARLQNATTAGRPAASAGTKGRMVYDTDLEDVFVDRGGTWKKLSLEKYVLQDASGWTGSVSQVVYTVSSEVSDARECIWVFKDNSNAFEQLAVEITMTQTQVTVTAGFNLPAGTYTLVGVG